MSPISVRRLDFGYFVRPGEETATGKPRVEPCLGYVIEHPDGTFLFDTGWGSDPEVDAHYRPHPIGLHDALAAVGLRLDEITHASNCHLHFDHCGGNPLLGAIPVFAQARELEEARTTLDYTVPRLIDAPGTRWEVVDGEAEVLPGVLLVPTPGHTDGHQSVVVRRSDGVVIVAGQSHDSVTEYGADVLALRARRESHGEPLPVAPAWLERLQQFDPSRVVFAHDHSVWMP
jgi:N-acyl homoserine lactone hydrolase